jgi:hypothetical protein
MFHVGVESQNIFSVAKRENFFMFLQPQAHILIE